MLEKLKAMLGLGKKAEPMMETPTMETPQQPEPQAQTEMPSKAPMEETPQM